MIEEQQRELEQLGTSREASLARAERQGAHLLSGALRVSLLTSPGCPHLTSHVPCARKLIYFRVHHQYFQHQRRVLTAHFSCTEREEAPLFLGACYRDAHLGLSK